MITTNRLTERLKNGTTENIEKYVYDSLGRLVTAKKGTSGTDDAVSKSIFSYDALSRALSESQAVAGGTAKTVNYSYGPAGNRLTLRYHRGGVTATYAYDSRQRCSAICTELKRGTEKGTQLNGIKLSTELS